MRLQIVHLRVNDAESGKPTPCRIRITDPNNQEYAPLGRPLEFSCNRGEDVGGHCRLGGERWFSIDGASEIALPPGELRVQVRKGLEYSPIDEVIYQAAGKMSIRLTIQRQTVIGNAAVAIDMRCQYLSPHAALLDAAAEDLDYVQLLAEPLSMLGQDGNVHTSVPNLAAFSGQKPCLDALGTHVIVNTHNRHRILGSLGLLNCHRVVNPLTFGDESDDWNLRDWAGQCHRKGGLVVWTEPFGPNKPFAGEALALAILGEIDAFELSPDFLAGSLKGWYQLLNAGIRLPIVGASGRIANDRPLGALRTVCWEDNARWFEFVRLGNGVVTNGPHCNLCLEGTKAHFSAISTIPFDHTELIVDSVVVKQCDATRSESNEHLFVATSELDVCAPSWVATRVVGSTKSPIDPSTMLFGHTSVQRIGEPNPEPKAVAFLQGHLDRGTDWVENHGRFVQPKFKKQLLDTFAEAKAKLLSGKRS